MLPSNFFSPFPFFLSFFLFNFFLNKTKLLNHGQILGKSQFQVVAIHKKGSGSRNNVMMEYGFFPGIHEENEEWKINNGCTLTHNHHNHTDNYCDQMTDLNLKMGLWSDSSSPSPSSSSLSSLTTATTYSATAARRTATTGAASNTCSLDLSLKLSY